MKFDVTSSNHLEFMKKFIISRYDVFAIQTLDGRYRKVSKPLTDATLTRHLNHEITVGCYNSTPESRCKFALIDIDSHYGKKTIPPSIVEAKLARVVTTLREFDIPYTLAESSEGNYHVYLFFSPAVETYKAYEYVRWILRAADLPDEECFPKQRQIPDREYGNLLRLCWSVHKKKDQLYHFINDEKVHIDEFEVQTIDLSDYEPIEKRMESTAVALVEDEPMRMESTAGNTSGSIPPCLRSLLENNTQFIGGGGHYARISIVCAYRDAGLSFTPLCRLFTQQDDYSKDETAKQVRSVLKKVGGYSYSCNTLRSKCGKFVLPLCTTCARGRRFK